MLPTLLFATACLAISQPCLLGERLRRDGEPRVTLRGGDVEADCDSEMETLRPPALRSRASWPGILDEGEEEELSCSDSDNLRMPVSSRVFDLSERSDLCELDRSDLSERSDISRVMSVASEDRSKAKARTQRPEAQGSSRRAQATNAKAMMVPVKLSWHASQCAVLPIAAGT